MLLRSVPDKLIILTYLCQIRSHFSVHPTTTGQIPHVDRKKHDTVSELQNDMKSKQQNITSQDIITLTSGENSVKPTNEKIVANVDVDKQNLPELSCKEQEVKMCTLNPQESMSAITNKNERIKQLIPEKKVSAPEIEKELQTTSEIQNKYEVSLDKQKLVISSPVEGLPKHSVMEKTSPVAEGRTKMSTVPQKKDITNAEEDIPDAIIGTNNTGVVPPPRVKKRLSVHEGLLELNLDEEEISQLSAAVPVAPPRKVGGLGHLRDADLVKKRRSFIRSQSLSQEEVSFFTICFLELFHYYICVF